MSRDEKWEAFQLLQCSLEGDDPPWLEEVLEERRMRLDRGEAAFSPWEEVRARLQARSPKSA